MPGPKPGAEVPIHGIQPSNALRNVQVTEGAGQSPVASA